MVQAILLWVSLKHRRSYLFYPGDHWVLHARIPKIRPERVHDPRSVSNFEPRQTTGWHRVRPLAYSICQAELQRSDREPREVYRQLLLLPSLVHSTHFLLLSQVPILQAPHQQVPEVRAGPQATSQRARHRQFDSAEPGVSPPAQDEFLGPSAQSSWPFA